MNQHLLKQVSPDRRKKVKALLQKQLDLRLKQREIMYKFVYPLDRNIKLLKDVIYNKEYIEEYTRQSRKLDEWMQDFFSDLKEGKNKNEAK